MIAPTFNLRPYQDECVTSIMAELREGRRTLAVMPTGTGKTVCFGAVAAEWQTGRVLVMAHRDELIRQAQDKVGSIVGETPEIEMGDDYAMDRGMLQSHVVVTSVQTMCRERRHSRFTPDDFGLLIIDEAHHAVASTYQKVIDYFSQNENLKILGVTATPDRADEMALGKIFESVAFQYEISDAIRDGWLVPVEQQFVFVEGLDFSNARTTAGDLNGGDLAAEMEKEKALHGVVMPTMELAGDQQTLIFASSVAHAERMCEIINRHRPHSAEFVSGKTPTDERREMIRRYSRGEFQFLCNCGVATEGFDEPRIGVVAIARPTKSRSLYAQMAGRGTRVLPGVVDGLDDAAQRLAAIRVSSKPSVLILDFVGNSGRHKLCSTADILGGNYDDAIVDRARDNAAKKSAQGERADMTQELFDAKQQIEEEGRRRRSAITAQARYQTTKVNPFDVFDIVPNREPGWHKGRKPTPKMAAYLVKCGLAEKDIAELSFAKAGQLIGEINSRRDKGLCTYKQAKLLAKYGESTDVGFSEASQRIDAIARNGWKPLPKTEQQAEFVEQVV